MSRVLLYERDGGHHIKETEAENWFELEQEEEHRFMGKRRRDSFMTIFQCENCHHQNIKKRDAIMGTQDEKMCRYIKREILNAFWNQETSIVNASHRELMMDMRLG